MEGSVARELWDRIIALEVKVAALEAEEEDYEVLGSFAVSSGDSGFVGYPRDVEPDIPSIEELPIGDYGEDD